MSCPNTAHGGIYFSSDPALLAEVVAAAKRVAARPLIVKLSPDVRRGFRASYELRPLGSVSWETAQGAFRNPRRLFHSSLKGLNIVPNQCRTTCHRTRPARWRARWRSSGGVRATAVQRQVVCEGDDSRSPAFGLGVEDGGTVENWKNSPNRASVNQPKKREFQ